MQNDIVAKIQQGNWTEADVSEAVAEIVRLRRDLQNVRRHFDEADGLMRAYREECRQWRGLAVYQGAKDA